MLKFNKSINTYEDFKNVINEKITKVKNDGYLVVDTAKIDDFTKFRLLKYYKGEGYIINNRLYQSFMISWFDPRTKKHYK